MENSSPNKDTTRQDLITQILALASYERGMYGSKYPSQGQWVTTGPQASRNIEKRVGFCVQVRKGCGQFGSDLVFLRHADESLTTHENQSYYSMAQEQIDLARQAFSHLPEDEDYSLGYSCTDKILEVGFLIEKSASQPSQTASMMSMTLTNADGSQEKTMTAFI